MWNVTYTFEELVVLVRLKVTYLTQSGTIGGARCVAQKDEVRIKVEDTRVMEMFELCLPKVPHRVLIPCHDFSRVSLSGRAEVKD